VSFLALASTAVAQETGSRPREAAPALETLDEVDLEELERSAMLLMIQGQYAEALRQFERLAEVNPGHLRVWAHVSAMRLSLGDSEGALEAARRQLAVSPEYPTAYRLIGWALQASGRFEEAIAAFEQQSSRYPNEGRGYAELATAQVDAGRIAEAEATLAKGAAVAPDDPEVEAARAYLDVAREGRRGDTGKARAPHVVDAAVEQRAFTLVRSGILHAAAQRNTEAIESFDRALALSEEASVKSWVALYLAFFRLDETRAAALADSALSELTSLVEAPDTSSDASLVDRRLWDLAWAWSASGMVSFMKLDLATAKPYLAAGLLWAPIADNAELLAQIHELEKETTEAKRYFAIALATQGNVSSARESLERLLANGETVDEVVRREWVAHRGRLEIRRPRPAGVAGSAQAMVGLNSDGVIEDVRLRASSPAIDPLLPALAGGRFEIQSPPRSPSRLVVRAEIDCRSEASSCVVRLLPPPALF
jgi:tetratricopeptide (TPR) repeat protein